MRPALPVIAFGTHGRSFTREYLLTPVPARLGHGAAKIRLHAVLETHWASIAVWQRVNGFSGQWKSRIQNNIFQLPGGDNRIFVN